MGNNCVAGGGCPHQANIVIINNTRFELELNLEEKCERNCRHRGFKVLDGKIVAGHLPPRKIPACESGQFSVSGREGTAVAPKGRVFYCNKEANLYVIFDWAASGWTSTLCQSHGCVAITGIPPRGRGWFVREPKPWNQGCVDPGACILDQGWIQDPGARTLEPGSPILGPASWIESPES